MTFRTLIRRSLRFHWRSHLGVVLGAAIGSAALIGALVVGDSVKGSLRERALERLGRFDTILDAGDRLISIETARQSSLEYHLGEKPTDQIYHGSVESLLRLNAVVARADGKARANNVNIFGCDEIARLFLTADSAVQINSTDTNRVVIGEWDSGGAIQINESLAAKLNVGVGDQIIVRLPKPTNLSSEAALSPRAGGEVALRLEVSGIVAAARMGNLSFHSTPSHPLNAFLSIWTLGRAVGVTNMANSYASIPFSHGSAKRPSDPAHLAKILTGHWGLRDIQLSLKSIDDQSQYELKSSRIFLDSPIVRSSFATDPNAQPLLTYLATLLRAGTNAAPYSMVTAAGAPWTPSDLRDDEIVVSQWLADDLRLKPGDEIAQSYFLPESGAKLEEVTNTFRVHSVVPLGMPWADRTLMPDFAGIEKAESTSDWDAGFPLTYKVRPKDDDYWKQHRGMPKAFITLAAGQKMWGNRFGNLTAIRFPIPTNEASSRLSYKETLEKKILANLKPEELGLRFEPVREQALKAVEESQDFGGLFLGFSFFLIIAALLLMAMLFQFGLEQRAPEIGTLLALGFTPAQVRKLFLREGVVLASIGGVIGGVGGIYYAKAMIHGLSTIWRDAVGATALSFHVTGQTLVMGLFASVVVSTITIWLALRKFVRRTPRELLAGEIHPEQFKAQSAKSKVIAVVALVGALGLVGWALARGDTPNVGAFFGAGALVLIAGLAFANARLGRLSIGDSMTLASLAVRGCARRRRRSLATMAMLACGSFLIVSIGVFRLDANRDSTKRESGTGGFALIGEATLPVVQDLNTASGRDFFALNEGDLLGVNFVPFRVRAGDEASCLNLNAAQMPRLLGVKPEMLDGRFAFTKGDRNAKNPKSWKSLKDLYWFKEKEIPLLLDEIPAIGDANSIQWGMHKKVGDTIDYVDQRGQPFKVRIVGALASSILQGQLIIDEAEFVNRFPGESGYRMFLMDVPSNAVSKVSDTLSRAMQDVGLELTPTVTRLNQFNAVQNTYLGTFQVLGGLGLLLGSVGLGIVVLRNVLERRGELAVMMAVGFRKATLQWLLLLENGGLLLAGLALGIIAATVAVLPALLSANGELPVMTLTITLGAVLLNGAAWTWGATKFAVRGDLLRTLRDE